MVQNIINNLKRNKIMECKCCKREQELRLGFCFDCVNAESLIEEGVDMYDKPVVIQEGMSTSMSKVQAILREYFPIKI